MIEQFIKNAQKFTKTYAYPGSDYIKQVEQGQSAKVLLIGCSDSLVDPSQILGAKPNEIFVHRNISAIVPPFEDQVSGSPNATAAVLDFAVNFLKVSDIIIFGHGHCGGMKALANGLDRSKCSHDFIGPWVKLVQEAHQELLSEGKNPEDATYPQRLEKRAIVHSLKHLKEYPWIHKKLASGHLTLHGWHYDRGVLSMYDAKNHCFENVEG